ncbi:SusD/RagB family nutrient-binding outer membrane lipoprotein [Plebeiibacterium sediminum]|uniref:SusD/RagB family nutrient-binding outer membrane lipoprotein n=1 Tax=Plebeiibacterium sediminum TaxID=2992112 RepID=A0AAE3M794_9BACT|nr:SusD/RagB family nutrient-binding outer membrane lipoprotein [Plebeiobacterium sediminum]MCW3788217.1 SusD/RagB family nutrient-binding outer membrane lipoprotein [Plebeiobacterium sediminum]
MKKLLFILIAGVIVLNSCTDDFEDANINPYQISQESLRQDHNDIGSFYPKMLANIFGHQIEENLIAESFCNYMATPTPFVSGVNNTTYSITWNTYWERIYNSLMAPAQQAMNTAQEQGEQVFNEWAKLIRILGISRLTTYHGPLIYSTYGEAESRYDSEEQLYTALFADLDDIQEVFAANLEYEGIKNFDDVYEGKIAKWAKIVNSMRLRLAIRISKVAPALAKAQGEKAIADAAGLITSSGDDFYIPLYGSQIYLAVITGWDDTRMSAAMESILVGLKDARIAQFFEAVSDESLVADHPEFPYKGVRAGGRMEAKSDHLPYSKMNPAIAGWEERPYLTSSEVYFDLAEAALRGWEGAGDAQANYEAGVRASFAQWGASGVDAYLADATSTPINYNDVVYDALDDGTVNDFVTRSTVTVAWNEAASNEEKLEKIITQKWIAAFTNPNEPWADFRRTGYPKLPHVYNNLSNADWGIIPADEWIKRMPFVQDQRITNAAAIETVEQTMNGTDLISTRLWWDTEAKDEVNF